MSNQASNLLDTEMNESSFAIVKRFIIGVTQVYHTSDWPAMLKQLTEGIKSPEFGSGSVEAQAFAIQFHNHLPEIQKIMEACYDPDEGQMLENLQRAMDIM